MLNAKQARAETYKNLARDKKADSDLMAAIENQIKRAIKKHEFTIDINCDRIETLKSLKANGVLTWASFEPVIDPEESLTLLEITLKEKIVDLYKIGKLNQWQGIDKNVDWKLFLENCQELMIKYRHQKIYYKIDLIQSTGSNLKNDMDSIEIIKPF